MLGHFTCLYWAADCCTATLDASAAAAKHIDCSSQAGVGAAKTIMMTMIPVDYHTCFIAISPHAKILYANESMASLLGRKVTEISGKMSLPQLMTIPCQQLHQNFFKVGTLLTACGLHACTTAQLVAESSIRRPSGLLL